ncbi:MAG: phosphotransferase, partial [Nitrospinaceae bacterium]|nr:phosphotransferase [Nitrospinaceae bacterium]NIR53734.1 phosphotransferase [Nitrospinaceae bacterium]NIS84142.1 phosphotransferase [Nitrospinaceae bacterium]NIT80943.1 phosphotransferase [Nitrospinaceae bacterium]NIU43241.1 phosphotransferase [Nitrospinaceae bacterium]
VLMQLAQAEQGPETDFTRILKFLKSLDLPVPELYGYEAGRGLLILEDCGDHTLEAHLRDHPGQLEDTYRRAVELLSRLQTRATSKIGPDCPAYHLRFDVKKLMWEFDFMLEHYVGGLHKSPLRPRESNKIRNRFLPLCQTLADQPLCFTHRDYHSRNLMVKNGDLMILDFQDARMGPCQYDLVSLLKDSYLILPRALREELIDRFIELKEKEEGRALDRP